VSKNHKSAYRRRNHVDAGCDSQSVGAGRAVYSRKRIGPRTDPCGTPDKTAAGADINLPQRTF